MDDPMASVQVSGKDSQTFTFYMCAGQPSNSCIPTSAQGEVLGLSFLLQVSSWDCLRYVSTHVLQRAASLLCCIKTAQNRVHCFVRSRWECLVGAANWAGEVSSCVAT